MVDVAGGLNTCGGYKIIRTLGEGGTAVVKMVEKDGQKYAMKIFTPAEQDRESVKKKTK